ncbi:thiamine transporter 1-like [Pseudomyrmex gracilis]|uniref:thiamine transporter 1-like n=1 Tax=Pseudomyrmex gracilis TaxID=219809 RepID=UPI000995BE36|nr:thiamine transporter 1-like [Pseudomyrmex gracilis]XP_020287298.1 thiamine transporter 1-like [Pseudomyrmex gracilis]XP_020287299.1 thiamine transporter 1-like [Pseudomyrmex gracilis]XP_020287300.1 thiamine transporter 1-like [Pseudomyrmex gracilis]XP_020287301.1 thiamine transporter 1-like [Pseudomyrmex gracilis]
MHWLKISCILCMFGCFKDFRPSESFITDYLTGPWKGFTPEEVNELIYPVSTYSYMATLILVFLITDLVRYKPIIILCGLSGIVTYIMIIVGKSVLIFQILEFFYGLYYSTEVAYYTYIYAKVDKEHYQKVTGHTKAAVLIGRSMSGLIAQLTASFRVLDYHQLNYLTLTSITIATVWALFLPSVGQSIYFHRANACEDERRKRSLELRGITVSVLPNAVCNGENSTTLHHSFAQLKAPLFYKIRNAYVLLWKHFVQAYANDRVLKWSVWWALATCGYLQVISYVQLLWQTAVGPDDEIYNGAVDFIYAILSAAIVFCIGMMRLNWNLLGDITLFVFSLLEGLILLLMSFSDNIWFLYAGYIIFGVIYHTMVTVASFEVAKYISEDSYGLVFGINMFLALVVQSLLTFVVINTLAMSIRPQFFVYSSYFMVLAMVYLVMGVVNVVQLHRSGESFHFWVNDNNNPSVTQNASNSSNETTTSSKSEHNDS